MSSVSSATPGARLTLKELSRSREFIQAGFQSLIRDSEGLLLSIRRRTTAALETTDSRLNILQDYLFKSSGT